MKEKTFFIRSFFVLFIISSIVLYSYMYYESHNTPEAKLEKRLRELYYPEHGYYYADGTIKYPDGRVIIVTDGQVENYTVNIYQATSAVKSLLAPYNSKLASYSFTLSIDYEHFTETFKDNDFYFVFPIKMNRKGHNDNILVGYAFVDRKNGRAFIKGLLG